MYLGDGSSEGLQAIRDHMRKSHPATQVHIGTLDTSSEEAVDEFFSKVTTTLGRIDFAVNVCSQAQVQASAVPVGHDVDGFDRNYRVYQRGVCTTNHGFYHPLLLQRLTMTFQTFLMERALLRQFLKQDVLLETGCRGSIVNVVDYGPTPSLTEFPVLASIAFSIIGFSKTDACDYASDKIRVNCLAASEVMLEKTRPELPGGVPLPRKGAPSDVANAALWLSAPSSSWLTGLVVPVDGGRSLHHWW